MSPSLSETYSPFAAGVKKAVSRIEYQTNLVTLCMARGALDFYMFSPLTLLEKAE